MSIIQENVSLKPFNTFHLDIKARYLAELSEVGEIQDFVNSPDMRILTMFILGGGSNVLFAADFEGVVIRPVIKGISITGENIDSVFVSVGAGENWDSFVAWCVGQDLGGIENLSLIPGSVGASPIQNIGAYGVEAKESIQSVEAVKYKDGKLIRMSGGDCRFGYRDSIFKHELKDKVIITRVTYKLDKKHHLKIGYAELNRELKGNPHATIGMVREAVIKIRRSKLPDPDDIGNAGSFFKNPVVTTGLASELRRIYPAMPEYPVSKDNVKLSAAWLIDQCGWKGKRSGNTGSYEKQPLILINYGSATGAEILDFARDIQKSVTERFGLMLEMEVNVVGGSDQVMR